MGCSCSALTGVDETLVNKKVEQAHTTRVLALRECGLRRLPPTATGPQCAGFRVVDLTVNELKSLPETCSTWSGLQTLLAGQNRLTELPVGLGQLSSMQALTLSKNKLRTLPIELSELGMLKVLQLDSNLLSQGGLPADFFAGALSRSMTELDLSDNGLQDLPASITKLAALKRLFVKKNKLSALPDGVGGLAKLQHLDAADNSLSDLPDNFLVNLTSLSELWLKGNPMDRLKLQEAPGFDAFLVRRKQRLDARIDANVVGRVDLTVCGLE